MPPSFHLSNAPLTRRPTLHERPRPSNEQPRLGTPQQERQRSEEHPYGPVGDEGCEWETTLTTEINGYGRYRSLKTTSRTRYTRLQLSASLTDYLLMGIHPQNTHRLRVSAKIFRYSPRYRATNIQTQIKRDTIRSNRSRKGTRDKK